MRVTRGKYFEGTEGHWEKIEIELDSSDLLPEEQDPAVQHLQATFLELRAEQQIIAFMVRIGQITREEAKELSEEIRQTRLGLLPKKPQRRLPSV